MSEPIPTEVSITASVGGKVQIVKYEYSEDYFVSMSQKFSVPEDWNDDEVEVWRKGQYFKLRDQVQELGQREVDALMAMRDGTNEE